MAPLRQHLKGMLRTLLHRLEYAANEPERHVRMKQVAHRVHENPPRRFPRARQIKRVFVQRHSKAPAVAVIPHRSQTQRQAFGIAVLAAGADLRATRHRIPRRLCPFDM